MEARTTDLMDMMMVLFLLVMLLGLVVVMLHEQKAVKLLTAVF